MVVSGAPDEPGVYMLLEEEEVIYYGCAVHCSTIQSALYEILQRVRDGDGGCLQRVTRYSWEITHRPRLREAELLREHEQAHQHPPRCNQTQSGMPAAAFVAGERRRS